MQIKEWTQITFISNRGLTILDGIPVIRNPQRFEKEQLQTRDYDRDTSAPKSVVSKSWPCFGNRKQDQYALLQTFRMDGWRVTGVEPDRNLARYTTAKLGIEALNGILESADITQANPLML